MAIGVPLSALATWLHARELEGLADWRFPELLHQVSALPLAAGIAASVFVGHRSWQHYQAWGCILAAGRMPLTNYVGQSFIMALIAEPWGFSGYATFSSPLLTGLAFAVFTLLAIVSYMWLSRFRMGPLEWMWRCGTYWRAFPNRL